MLRQAISLSKEGLPGIGLAPLTVNIYYTVFLYVAFICVLSGDNSTWPPDSIADCVLCARYVRTMRDFGTQAEVIRLPFGGGFICVTGKKTQRIEETVYRQL
jgi:hypothetical protein